MRRQWGKKISFQKRIHEILQYHFSNIPEIGCGSGDAGMAPAGIAPAGMAPACMSPPGKAPAGMAPPGMASTPGGAPGQETQ